jgi:tetrapyrrole methylase family protein/MazG family protein/ATP diphosphatase
MIRRHPHVFGDASARNSAEQTEAWEVIKAGERAAKGKALSLLDDVPASLPAMTRAVKLTRRAARVGFDWPTAAEVVDKLREELAELEVEIEAGDQDKAREELGDLLFVIANLARKLDIEPEDALRSANAKFIRRFNYIEKSLSNQGLSPEKSSLVEMDNLWNAAKAIDKAAAKA